MPQSILAIDKPQIQEVKIKKEIFMPTLFELDGFLAENKIECFQAKELVHGLKSGNTVPPKELWKNILPTLKLAELARKDLHTRVKITSGYRNEHYNAKPDIGGSKNSFHIYFRALDCKPLDCPLVDFLDYILEHLNNPIDCNSWGIKEYNTFLHIDDRKNRYRNLYRV